MKRILIIVIILGAFGIGVFAGFDAHMKRSGPARDVTVIIPKGSGLSKIAQTMESEGYGPAVLFKAAAVRYGVHGRLKAGEYLFSSGTSPYDALLKMSRGEVVVHAFTAPEGWTTRQIIDAVRVIPQLSGDITKTYNEGELLPETYQFTYGDTREALLDRMQAGMQRLMMVSINAVTPSGSTRPALGPQEILILASIVEKETGKPEERSHVAAVYLNRLAHGMKLQADPTVAYALTKGEKEMERPLIYADLKLDSPYNTYMREGLPPGPICNPGRASIQAVLSPAQTEDLFFVADGAGGHRFAKNEREHLKNVMLFRKWQAANR